MSKLDPLSWFNLKNYAELASLDKEEIEKQLDLRYFFLLDASSVLSDQNSQDDCCFKSPDCYRWRAIINGEPIIDFEKEYRSQKEIDSDAEFSEFLKECQKQVDEDNKDYLEQHPDFQKFHSELQNSLDTFKCSENCIASSEIIGGIQVRSIKRIYEKLCEKELIGPKNILDGIAAAAQFSDINISARKNDIKLEPGQTAYIHIELDKASDDEILQQLKRLLPTWRRQLNISKPNFVKDTPSILGKVVTYKIIPYLDLLIWATLFEQKLTYENYVDLLFSGEDRDVDNFKQVILPHEKKVKQLFDRKYEFEIRGKH